MAAAVQSAPSRVLIIACGALAREITALQRASGWSAFAVRCLPPELHNRPERIAPAVREVIRAERPHYASMFVAYADCGTGGVLDAMLAQEGVERLPGAHCYEAFATSAVFAQLADEEPGTFYLTDFLLRHFERLVIAGLGIDRHPELAASYFANYRRLTYLAQTHDERARARAAGIAQRMGLEFQYRFTGYGELGRALQALHERARGRPWPA